MCKIINYVCWLLAIVTISCDKTRTPNLEIGNYYEFPVGKTSTIAIQGSGDYQIVVEDTSILDVACPEINKISVSPIRQGETFFTVFDKKTGDSAKSIIKIVDFYISFLVGNPLQPPFLSNDHLFFVENDTNDLYIFDNGYRLSGKGHYSFGKTEENFTLTILFDKAYNGYTELYLVLKNNGDVINQFIYKMILRQDGQLKMGKTYSREAMPLIMTGIDERTNARYHFVLKDITFPYHIL